MLVRGPDSPPDASSPLAGASDAAMQGFPLGRVWPPRGEPTALQHVDAREHGLLVLARFISLLHFARAGDIPGKPTRFYVKPDHIHVHQPNSIVPAPARDGVGILPGRAEHVPYSIGPAVTIDESADRFGPGTVLVRRGDHVETIGLEVVATEHPIRLGIVAGLKEAFTLDGGSGALRLRMDDYFCLVATFLLQQSEQLDDEDAATNRRRGHLFVQMTVPEVSLVRYARTRVVAGSDVSRLGAASEE